MSSKKVQLMLQTSSLITGFMVWVIISSLIPFIKQDIPLTDSQTALVTAIPVLLGSFLRIPIGFLTNRIGARLIHIISLFLLLIPVFLISRANSMTDLIIGGFLIGIGGAIFSVGVTSLPKYYPKENHGFVNGIYGLGNAGTAITTFSAPVIARSIGWVHTVQLYLVLLVVFILLNIILGDRKEQKMQVSLSQQIKEVYKNSTLWFLCLFYFITFGAFVAFTVYLPNFLVTHFALDKVDAGIRTAGFIVLATLMRPIGGWLADKFNPFKILMFVFIGLAFSGVLLSFSPTFKIYSIGVLTIAFCAGIGNGTIFKLVPLYFSKQSGIVNGIVSAMGGLGGFFPPLVLTFVYKVTGQYSIGFMAISEFALVSFVIVVWLYFSENHFIEKQIIDETMEGIIITNKNLVIENINPAFSRITGFTKEEVIGKKPNILQSGKHDLDFYKGMWEAINRDGYWEGEIWNKRKNGEFYNEWITISVIKGKSGEIKHYVGMFNDLTPKTNF
jgi:NNP family nitrate/nitrite transporter-like MFS transporter